MQSYGLSLDQCVTVGEIILDGDGDTANHIIYHFDGAHVYHCKAIDLVTSKERGNCIHLNRDLRHGFDHIFANHTNMVSRTAGDDIDSLKRSQLLICKPCLRKINVSLFYISANGVLNGLRLLMDLFQHKVLIAALFRSIGNPRCSQ